ncbi:hypothetical protein M378DRAFT_275298 [Amanita muscaria Koide BX008]|uniref:Uncharacterized protein n=1 Tax=Amanita muscaria (strain Koide BX008) TaxID=946122 RepID=A0A0C2WS46_AMAMK|nr:hypothetical protein M378DRAFT_275298 [Amanita muscaria Koide BX008]
MSVALDSDFIDKKYFFLNSNLRAKFEFIGLFAWWVREALIYGHEEYRILAGCTYESNTSAFARLFHSVCFEGCNANLSNRLVKDASNRLINDAMQLIERCRAKDSKSRPTMEDVVQEMETWGLT